MFVLNIQIYSNLNETFPVTDKFSKVLPYSPPGSETSLDLTVNILYRYFRR